MYSYKNVIDCGSSYGRILEIEREGISYALKEFLVVPGSKIIGIIHLKEVDLLKRCQHPFILAPKAITYGKPYKGTPPVLTKSITDSVYLIMPLAEESCFKYIRNNEANVQNLKRIMLQITHALAYLHTNNICYRDVKSSNVLVFPDESYPAAVKGILCDMGMCKPLTETHINSDHVGTSGYKPPEVLLGIGHYSFPMDVWGLGILFFELFNFNMPFERQRPKGNIKKQHLETSEFVVKIFHNRGSPTTKLFNKLTNGGNTIIAYEKISGWSHKPIQGLFDNSSRHLENFEVVDNDGLRNFGTKIQYCELLERILKVDPNERPTMVEILNDPFFQDIPKEHSDQLLRDQWHGLTNPVVQDRIYHVLEKVLDDEKRNKGLEIIDGISIDFCPSAWRIAFLGLDIYDRCLLMYEKAINGLIIDIDPQLLAFCSCYIATKYFLDESTSPISMIFPRCTYPIEAIVALERSILVDLDWKIYRPTIYDILDKKPEPEVLMKLLMSKTSIYGYTIDKIATVYKNIMAKSND